MGVSKSSGIVKPVLQATGIFFIGSLETGAVQADNTVLHNIAAEISLWLVGVVFIMAHRSVLAWFSWYWKQLFQISLLHTCFSLLI